MNVVVLRRRLIYIIAMVVLLIPIYMLGQPSIRKPDGTEESAGGALAQIRSKYDLGQGDLGDIDPASESMRLATLGLRGVAATVLWQRAEYYKREQYWDRYSATLNQISKLQPHFVKVWDFLSWNLSYNISVEFDDYRQRYAWVKKGIDYLIVGTKYNRRKTDLPYELGWKFGNKFGVSDEKIQFRELYRQDVDWHKDLLDKGMDVNQQEGLGPDNRPDSWLTGRLWYERCYAMVREGSLPCKSPTNFYRLGPMWMLSYAQSIEAEGVLNYAAKLAWKNGGEAWAWFGDRQIRSTWGEDLRMSQLKEANERVAKAKEEFLKLCGEKNDQMQAERKAKLTPEQQEALAIPDLERTSQQLLAAYNARALIEVPYREVADAMPEKDRFKANELALKIKSAEEFVNHIEIYRNQVNYTYWETRSIAEQSDEAIAARSDLYAANNLLNSGRLEEAEKKFESAWKNWDDLFNKYPYMMIDDSAEEVEKAIKAYRRKVIDGDLPKDFILNDFLQFREAFIDGSSDPRINQALAEWSTNPNRGAWFERVRKARAADAAAAAAAAADAASKDQPSSPDSKPSTETPPAEKPTAEKPATEKPATEKPATEQPKLSEQASRPEAGTPPTPKAK